MILAFLLLCLPLWQLLVAAPHLNRCTAVRIFEVPEIKR